VTIGASSSDPRLDGIEDWIAAQLGPAPNFKGVRYLSEYLRLFGAELDSIRRIVELGVAEGASLLAWSRLCPQAACLGVDLHRPARLELALARLGIADRVELLVGDHNEPDGFASAIPEGVDLIVDDGSHRLMPTERCFRTLFPKLRPGGWYCIEDWGAGYWESFGGPESGVHRLVYELVDEIAIKDRMKPEAGRFRIPVRLPMPIEEMRVKGVEPIVFIRKKQT
jgi:methyltransferase family protein